MTGLIRGSRVALRPATLEDRRTLWSWATESDVAHHLYGPAEKRPSFEEWITDYVPAYFDDSRPLEGQCYVIRSRGEEMGQVNSNTIDAGRGRTELDIWLRDEAACGRGLGSAAIETLCNFLCMSHGVTEFMMQPAAGNARAVRAYAKTGFEPLGLPLAEAETEWNVPADGPDAHFMVKRMPARLRALGPDDAAFLEQMLYEAVYWNPAGPRPPLPEGLASPELAKLLRGFGERRGDAGLVALGPDAESWGVAWYRLWRDDDHSYGYVDAATPELGIALVEGARGRGVGAQLLRSLAILAGSQGFDQLSLSVADGNPARRLYAATGFESVGHDEGDAETMRLTLAS